VVSRKGWGVRARGWWGTAYSSKQFFLVFFVVVFALLAVAH
jgi:hypothetical protein